MKRTVMEFRVSLMVDDGDPDHMTLALDRILARRDSAELVEKLTEIGHSIIDVVNGKEGETKVKQDRKVRVMNKAEYRKEMDNG
jgi:hypothetical protein